MVKIIATGGLAKTVSVATDVFDVVDPELTLRGFISSGARIDACSGVMAVSFPHHPQ